MVLVSKSPWIVTHPVVPMNTAHSRKRRWSLKLMCFAYCIVCLSFLSSILFLAVLPTCILETAAAMLIHAIQFRGGGSDLMMVGKTGSLSYSHNRTSLRTLISCCLIVIVPHRIVKE